MTAAYVDTSVLVSIVFSEPQGKATLRALKRFEKLYASPLLEAELRSALSREEVDERAAQAALRALHWVLVDRPLSTEIGAVLHAGYVRGADLWHLATALFLAGTASSLPFLTLDAQQGTVAARLGFPTPLQGGQ